MSGLSALTEQNNKDEIVPLENGADINEKDSNGNTALYNACLKKYIEIGKLLENNKINVNMRNNCGRSPFLRSCWDNSNENVLLMLQDARVDTNMADMIGWSPLMAACCWGNTKTVQLLLSYGRYIDIHKKSTQDYGDIKLGSTALGLAKQQNKTDIVQLLEQYQNNPKETQKTLRNQLNLKGKK